MSKKLLIVLIFMAEHSKAMTDDLATPAVTDEQKIILTIQNKRGHKEQRKLPALYIPIIGVLNKTEIEPRDNAYHIPISSWSAIEGQLKRVHEITQGNANLKEDIMSDFRHLKEKYLYDLILSINWLDIAILKEIILTVAQERLHYKKIKTLPGMIRNEIIKRKLLKVAGPLQIKETAHFDCSVPVHFIETMPSGEIISGSPNTIITCGNINTEHMVNLSVRPDVAYFARPTSDGKIVFGSCHNKLYICDINHRTITSCSGHESWINAVCLTPNNTFISGSNDHTIRTWDMNGKQLALFEGHEDAVSSVCFTPDETIVSGSWDNTVRVWDKKGYQLAIYQGHEDIVNSVGVAPDGTIVSQASDGTIRIWKKKNHLPIILKSHEGSMWPFVILKEGQIVSEGTDNTLCIWDTNGQELAVCRGHKDIVSSVCTASGDLIISGSWDSTVCVWDKYGHQLAICSGHKDQVSSVCVLPDRKIASGSFDTTVRTWDLSLLQQLGTMNKQQAKKVWHYLESVHPEHHENCWQEIRKIFEEKV